MSERRFGPETFRAPSRDFGILPFWFLNGELEPEEMRYQLRELREKGMQGVILHGRYGLEVPYIGETYLDRIALAVEEAKRLGLTTWIYDEMNWPSGTADKRVLAERPDLAQRYIECISFTIRGPWFMCLTGEDSRYLDFEKSEPVAAFAIGEDGRVLDLTANLSFGKVMPWEVPPGEWRLCYVVEKRADYYIDALDPESTAEFLRIGYQPYADVVGETFPDDVVGFYSDEPAMHYFLSAADNSVLPWTKHMFRRFAERNGYDLRPRLPDLFFEVAEDSKKIRHDFFTTLTDFYTDAYYRQIHEWCRERGVTFVAHLLYEEWLRRVTRVEGNLFKHYANMDVVGVDHLYPVIGTREAPDQHVAMKVASSAAHHFGSDRVICESFGGIFMDATMQRMKWIADWEFVLGVNVLNPHGFHYTLEGARKRDWPPSMFYQYPWWRHYDHFSEYMSRLSESLTGGRHVAKVALLYPINAMFAEYLPQVATPHQEAIESGFNAITDALLRIHHDFDYLDEDVLAEAEIEDGRLRVGDEEYELVLVPPMTHVKLGTVEALERFAAAGGKTLGVAARPDRALSADGLLDVADRVRTLFDRDGGAFVDGDAIELAADARAGGRRLRDALDEAIGSLLEPDVVIENDELFSLHRRKHGLDLHFVTNPTFEEQRARVSLPGDVYPLLFDPTDGAERPVGPIRIEDGRTSFDLRLPPVGSTFVVVGVAEGRRIVDSNLILDRVTDAAASGTGTSEDGWIDVRVNGHVARTTARAASLPDPIVLDDPWRFELDGLNALVLDRWEASPERERAGGASPEDADADGWVPVGHGAWSYQLGAEPARAYPIPVWYRASFEVDDVPSRLELVIDGFDGAEHRIHLNGAKIAAEPVRASFDAQMRSVDLTPHVRRGPNELAIRLVVEGPTGGIVDRLKVMGTFSLPGTDDGWRIAAPVEELSPAPWTEQGHPFLSGTATYRTTVEVPEAFDAHRLFLEIPARDDVIEVSVNGRSAGVRLWDPYEVEVTDLLTPGANELSIAVTNTLANLLNADARPSGLAGPPRLLARASFEFDLAAAEATQTGSEGEG
ncbi:MAG TPA: glycosyl hydrolase [Actinomycetota bacterium]|nr:glycosyl hydrolase [Actinomycetota bacterium]